MKDVETEARVRGAVARATGWDASGAPVRRLAGHASMRSYWRVGTYEPRGTAPGAAAAARTSQVVMVMPPDAKPEEITKGGPPTVDPFVDVQAFLRRLGARVPEILAFFHDDPRGGLMVLEDLGDEMLETRLLAGDPPEPLYERAIDQLAAIRAGAERIAERERAPCVAFTRAFDHDLYLWELHHFREWLLEAWKGRALSPAERARVDREFEGIARALDAEPKGFTHRDYQSRNLMVLPTGEQAIIDFQDALLGPRQYDLVALLRDSYVELPADLVDRMIRRYLERLAGAGGPRLGYEPFRAVFDLLTVQRKLKDAGRFVFIDRVKKNSGFLPSIPASLRYVREAFARRPELAGLQEILGRHVPELAA
ncbi:MAG TPA: phosphotransferase [Candidatus Limnocylindria bacterium]|nr:phosphotransferase [Candidatus Limnocylindria bacterium]